MSFKATALFAALLFTLALVNAPPAEACDQGGVQPGNPTFSFTQAQPVYAPQAFVQQPVVTQQFVQQHHVQQFAVQPFVQHQQAVVLQNVAPVHVQAFGQRGPRRQVTTTRQVTSQRSGGILGFRN